MLKDFTIELGHLWRVCLFRLRRHAGQSHRGIALLKHQVTRTVPKPKDERLLLLYRVLCRDLTIGKTRADLSKSSQQGKYRFGRSPRLKMKHIGPISLELKTRLERTIHLVHAQFTRKRGRPEMALYERQAQAVQGALEALSPILGPVIQTASQKQTDASTPASDQ